MIDYSKTLSKKEEEINEKLFNILLKGSENEFTRWMDKQHLCYPSNISLIARVANDKIKIYEGIIEWEYGYIPVPWDIDSISSIDETRYPGIKGKCVEYLKNNKPELYSEISDFIEQYNSGVLYML